MGSWLVALLILCALFAVGGTQAASLTNVCAGRAPEASAPSGGGIAAVPLDVGPASHIVVMEYEAWFSPGTGNGPQPNITTCLQSADMKALGGGYDSTAPGVIAQHVAWMEKLGVDAVTLDLTNDVSCIFDGDDPKIIQAMCPDPAFRSELLHIRDNDGLLYGAWTKLGTRLKIMPLLGGFDTYAVTPDPHDAKHRTALEKEADYFGALMARDPAMNVVYQGKPTMLLYLGTPVDPSRVDAIRRLLAATKLDQRYTFRLVGGYLDSQSTFWANPNATPAGPIKIASQYDFWSYVDRLNFWGAPPAPYYPTYNVVGGHVENLTVSLATAGQSGWNCASNGGYSYCADAALRYCGAGFANGCKPGDYETLHEFMRYARQLRPTFLILHQFNEFAEPDEGWNAETNDDAEPTKQWGYSALGAITDEIRAYRECNRLEAKPPA